jgi:hypothetical protein
MELGVIKMSPLSIKLGYWSALLIAIVFIVYTIVYVAILIVFPIPHWNGISSYAASINDAWFIPFTTCQFLAFLTAPLFIILVNSIHDYAGNDKKVLAKLSIWFAIIFAVLSSIHYFIQFSAVRQNILQGHLDGLEQFVQLNPTSIIAAVNLLGWTLFLGLSSLFIVPIFKGGRLEKVIKYSFMANGIFCILGSIGYVFNIYILNFVFFNGMGASIIAIGISSSILFRRIGKTSILDEAK